MSREKSYAKQSFLNGNVHEGDKTNYTIFLVNHDRTLLKQLLVNLNLNFSDILKILIHFVAINACVVSLARNVS